MKPKICTNEEIEIAKILAKHRQGRKVAQLDKTQQIKKKYEGMASASIDTFIRISVIRECCKKQDGWIYL